MPSNAEIAKDTIEQFKKIQRYMAVAKKEEAKETLKVIAKKRKQIERKLYQKPPLVSK